MSTAVIIHSIIPTIVKCLTHSSKFLSAFDPFCGQKEASYMSYTSSISMLAKYILSVTSEADMSVENTRRHLEHVILVSDVMHSSRFCPTFLKLCPQGGGIINSKLRNKIELFDCRISKYLLYLACMEVNSDIVSLLVIIVG